MDLLKPTVMEMENLMELSNAFLKYYKPLSEICGGIQGSVQNELVELYCLKNDISDDNSIESIRLLIKKGLND